MVVEGNQKKYTGGIEVHSDTGVDVVAEFGVNVGVEVLVRIKVGDVAVPMELHNY